MNHEEKYHEKVREFIYNNLPEKYHNTSLDEIPRIEFTDKLWEERNKLIEEFNTLND